jgi:hypothetical protein
MSQRSYDEHQGTCEVHPAHFLHGGAMTSVKALVTAEL